ncbi:MAG: DUF6370 family protein [Myxococcota bacterium]
MFTRRLLLLACLAATSVGCSGGTAVPEQVATVGCGMCKFHLPDSRGCYWAIQLDGVAMPVVGAHTPDHEAHGPDGMCVMERKARVAGRIKRGQFLADTFELLPAEGVDYGAAPPTHSHAFD